MRKTRRLKRMGRNRAKVTRMNLTSLMDVFTILVFFLLVNSGSVEIMEAPKNMTLPESVAEAKPRETVVIFINPQEVLVQNEVVANTYDFVDDEGVQHDALRARLGEVSASIINPDVPVAERQQEVTILADKSVPFIVIRKIMSLCTSEGYESVSLAVVEKASQVAAR